MLASPRQKHHRAPNNLTGCSKSGVPCTFITMKHADATKRRSVGNLRTGKARSTTRRESSRAQVRPAATLKPDSPAVNVNEGNEACESISDQSKVGKRDDEPSAAKQVILLAFAKFIEKMPR